MVIVIGSVIGYTMFTAVGGREYARRSDFNNNKIRV